MIMSDAIAIPILDARQHPAGFSPLSDRLFQAGVPARSEPAEMIAADRYDEGYTAGQVAARLAHDEEIVRLTQLLDAALTLPREPAADVAALIAETVATLVEQIVGAQPSDQAVLEQRAGAAAALIVAADDARTLWAHPDDVALLHAAGLALTICPDPDLQRGALRIDCATGWIEHGPGSALRDLRRALGVDGGQD
jgi:flagellar assembly protein FliH